MPEVKCKFNRHSPLKCFQPGNMEASPRRGAEDEPEELKKI